MTNGKTDQPTSEERGDIITVMSGEPESFVFDPATNFIHKDDGGAPDNAIKYVKAALSQPTVNDEFVEGLKTETAYAIGSFGGDNPLPRNQGIINQVIDHLHSQGLIGINPQWQPIETAPKSDGAILVYCADRRNVYTAIWGQCGGVLGKDCWKHFGGNSDLWEEPTHWMHIPPNPPQENNDARGESNE